MNLLTVILLLLTFLIALYRYLRPPAPVPYATTTLSIPLPLVGPLISMGINPIRYLQLQRRLHGDVFCMDLLLLRITFTIGVASNSQFARTRDADLDIWGPLEDKLGEWWIGARHRADWGDRYNGIIQTFLGDQRYQAEYRTELLPLIKKTLEEWSQQPHIDLFKSISNLIIRCVSTTLFGHDLPLEHFNSIKTATLTAEKYIQSPYNSILPRYMTKAGRDLNHWEKQWDKIVGEEVDRRMEMERQQAGYNKNRRDYLSRILCLDDGTGSKFKDILGAHMAAVMFAAHVNAYATTSWMAVHAISTPEIFTSIQNDIYSQDTVSSLSYTPPPFLSACFAETGRLYSNLIVFRQVGKQRPYTPPPQHNKPKFKIPSGEYVAVSPVLTARDTAVWGAAASCFLPERYFPRDGYTAGGSRGVENGIGGGDGKSNGYSKVGGKSVEEQISREDGDDKTYMPLETRKKRYEHMQFGAGPHYCKGEKFARFVVMELFWKTFVLEGYEFEAVDGSVTVHRLHDSNGVAAGVGVGTSDGKNWGKGEDELLAGGRRDVDAGATGVVPAWLEDNGGTPNAKGVVKVAVRRKRGKEVI